jgi:DNA-binding NarL/FixJ family response regulator
MGLSLNVSLVCHDLSVTRRCRETLHFLGQPMRIKVLLADDTEIVRTAIRRLLDSDPEIQLVAEAATFTQVIEIADKLQPHVIVMDLHMNRKENTTPRRLKSALDRSPLVAISIWNDDEAKALADSLGAVTLLDKINLTTELIPAIKLCVNLRHDAPRAQPPAP